MHACEAREYCDSSLRPHHGINDCTRCRADSCCTPNEVSNDNSIMCGRNCEELELWAWQMNAETDLVAMAIICIGSLHDYHHQFWRQRQHA